MADPRWRQIAGDLRTKIEASEIGADGRPLPTELELQDIYSASRNTVRDAVSWLAGRGLVYKRSGQGTFVAPKIDPFVTKVGDDPDSGNEESTAFSVAVSNENRTPAVSVPRVEIMKATGISAAELNLTPGQSVISRHQERRIDGVPYSLQTTFYPMAFLERGATRLIQAENIKEGAVHYLENLLKFEEVGRLDRIKVRPPDQSEPEFFGLPDDGTVPVMEHIRTGYDDGGEPIRVTVTAYPVDRNILVIASGRVPPSRSIPAP